MIRYDMYVAKRALKLTHNYADMLAYDPDVNSLVLVSNDMHTVINSVPVKKNPHDIPESINRLIEKGFFRVHTRFYGGFFFSITPELLHRHAFMWDRYTKKFIVGYLLGILSGTLAAFGGQFLWYLIQAW